MQQESRSMAHLFSCSPFFICSFSPTSPHTPPKPGDATAMELLKEAILQVTGKMEEKRAVIEKPVVVTVARKQRKLALQKGWRLIVAGFVTPVTARVKSRVWTLKFF